MRFRAVGGCASEPQLERCPNCLRRESRFFSRFVTFPAERKPWFFTSRQSGDISAMLINHEERNRNCAQRDDDGLRKMRPPPQINEQRNGCGSGERAER